MRKTTAVVLSFMVGAALVAAPTPVQAASPQAAPSATTIQVAAKAGPSCIMRRTHLITSQSRYTFTPNPRNLPVVRSEVDIRFPNGKWYHYVNYGTNLSWVRKTYTNKPGIRYTARLYYNKNRLTYVIYCSIQAPLAGPL